MADLEWGDPPPSPSAGERTPWHRTLDALATRPGEWAKVKTCNSQGAAAGTAARIKSGMLRDARRHAGRFEATTRKDGNTFHVYARFVGGES